MPGKRFVTFAVLGLGGVCTMLIYGKSAPKGLDCVFMPIASPSDFVADCAYRNKQGDIVMRATAVQGAYFGDDGIADVVIDGELSYLNPQGHTAPALPFDNGTDYFVEGLARTRGEGKIGFVNKELEVVILPQWDFAFPFDQGLAVVCNGCESMRLDGGEHSQMVGGKWGYTNPRGDVVVPLDYRRDELPSRATLSPSLREGCATTHSRRPLSHIVHRERKHARSTCRGSSQLRMPKIEA